MRCPGCRHEMQRRTLDALLGKTMDVHVCMRCRAFWFEPLQTIHLTPAATLTLIRLISERQTETPQSLPASCHCPDCDARLAPTHDRQRNTRFQYLRCEAGHGRFTPFVEFLKEKDFIRPLSQKQMAELKQNIRMIHCANCGAPVDLLAGSVCEHCASPVSMFDVGRLVKVAAAVEHGHADPPLRPDIARPKQRISAMFADRPKRNADPLDLIAAGLGAVADWMRKLGER